MQPATLGPDAGLQRRRDLKRKRSRAVRERVIESILFFAASVSVLITAGIVWVLVSESITFFRQVSLWDFLTDTQWTPLFDDAHFGIMVLLSGHADQLAGRALRWRFRSAR